jgi:hypothetical protein
MNRSKTVTNFFHDRKNVKITKISFKISQFLPIFANFSLILLS